MKKQYKILAILSFILLILFLGFPNNLVPPEQYFSSEKEPRKIYLEFKKGGEPKYYSKLSDTPDFALS